jgi:phage-related protein
MSMAITDNETAFVDATSVSIGLSEMFTVTPASDNPAYVVLTALDRNEYTATSTGATGSLSGNGHTLDLKNIGGDGRGAGIVFAYQASTGRYYNSSYGYLDQLTYTSSGSPNDVTNLSLFGTNSLTLANAFASNAPAMTQLDAAGYIGSATVATQPHDTGTVPSQATPASITAAADSFAGHAWNMDGCWVLASSIAAEAGAGLPVQSTLVGLPGEANGEWIVAFNGPSGQSGNWQSMVTAGEMIVFEPAGGGGHITTCVSGSGSTALLVDNVTYINGSDQVTNLANDGSSADIVVASPHPASQEFSGVSASSVVIYELDTPIVTAAAATESLGFLATLSLGSLFSATDPASKAITSWQVYDTASSDSLVVGGSGYGDHAASDALTAATLSAVSLLAGSAAVTDTLEVRAYNGSYWGDWTSLSVAIAGSAPPAPSAPLLETQTANQTWKDGQAISLVLAAGTFQDPQSETLTYTATLANGQALPSWLLFSPATQTFTGTPPATAQTLAIKVTATDTSGLSASETFSATVIAPPELTAQTPAQVWSEGSVHTLAVPANTFTDPQGESLSYAAALSNGQALPGWLAFNASTDTFSGTAPNTAQTVTVAVTATDTSGLSAIDVFSIAVAAPAPVITAQTANQTWTEGQPVSLTLPGNTFTDPGGETLSYAATLANGQKLPSWLRFNTATDSFSGTPPNTAQTLAIKVTATDTSGQSVSETLDATILATPEATAQTANQSWKEGSTISLALPAGTFTDPQGETLTYAATQQNGQPLPDWLTFNAATRTFSGTAPATAQTVDIKVTATDSSGLSASEIFAATVTAASTTKPGITTSDPTPNQSWADGSVVSLALPANTFTDALGLAMTFTAYEVAGPNVTSWLHFNASTDTLFGTVPTSATGTVELEIVATDARHMVAADLFSVTFAPSFSGQTGAIVAAARLVPESPVSALTTVLTLPN